MTDDLVARLRHEGDDEAVEALRFQEASIRRLERKLAAAEAKEHESFQQYVDANEARIDAEARVRKLEAELADQQTIAKYNREQAEKAERKLAEAYERAAEVADDSASANLGPYAARGDMARFVASQIRKLAQEAP